jgi:Gly-Xaa carboxypeptidase
MIAIPGIAEKGYVDVRVSVSTPGGHSSVPPPHTVSRCVFLADLI